MKLFLSKKTAWVLIIILVYIDAILDIIKGKEGNPLWTPFVQNFGIYIVLFLAIPVLILFYILIKVLTKIILKINKIPHIEKILLTTLVIIYAVFDLWLISVNFLNFSLIKNFRYTVPFLIIVGLIYALWAEQKVKRK